MSVSLRLAIGLALLGIAGLALPLVRRADAEPDGNSEPLPEGAFVRDVTRYERKVQAIYDELNSPIRVHRVHEKLHRTIEAIVNAHHLSVGINEPDSRKHVPSPDRLAAIEFRGRTVGEALTVLLDAYELDYYFNDVCITVEAAEKVRKRSELRAYDVGSLLVQGVTIDDVADVLPLPWNEAPHPVLAGNVIVVSLNRQGHARVLDFLKKSTVRSIRAEVARRAQPQPAKPGRPKDLTLWKGSETDLREDEPSCDRPAPEPLYSLRKPS